MLLVVRKDHFFKLQSGLAFSAGSLSLSLCVHVLSVFLLFFFLSTAVEFGLGLWLINQDRFHSYTGRHDLRPWFAI